MKKVEQLKAVQEVITAFKEWTNAWICGSVSKNVRAYCKLAIKITTLEDEFAKELKSLKGYSTNEK